MSYELFDVFDAEISSDFLEETIRDLRSCYRRSHDECASKYPSPVAHDARSIVRRAEFETSWKEVAERHGMSTSFEKNAGKNCYHLRIVKSRVILTASFIDYRVKSVRNALYRNDYAYVNQNFLFPELASPRPVDSPVYAILMHDVAPNQPWQLLYADIGFPDSTGKIIGRIRLADRFPRLFSDAEIESAGVGMDFTGTVPVVNIDEPAAPVLRQDIKKKESV